MILQSPLTYRELFNDFVFEAMPTTLDNWDNLAEGITMPDVSTFEHCMLECDNNPSCFQSVHDGNTTCTLGTQSFRLGEEKKAIPEEGKMWQSYWKKERMMEWADQHQDCSGWTMAYKDSFICGNPDG